MINFQAVSKVYQTDRIETLALDSIDVEIGKGEFVSVMGPSGCGKSTLLNLMGLLDAPTSGKITFGGETIEDYSDRRLARLRNEKLGFVFQEFHLINDLKVLDNVELPLLYRTSSSGERKARALKALDRVGLSSRVHHFPSQLSGGQQQRVALARAIVGEPDVLLADEPTGNLDSRMGADVIEMLQEFNREVGTTIVMVTHDAEMAAKTQRTLRIFDGRQVQ
ncbi:MAG: ABC transporter ATP-binding protein [Acidobacteriota bacterium]|nr:ABC transporter ATP-binding protein [Acidobacteriota bacterium]MDH3784500.1 ABC transporter ATP-binding protein [Acidobacteriota bacterium]